MLTLLVTHWRILLVVVLLCAVTGFLVHVHAEGVRAGEKAAQLSQMEDDKRQIAAALAQSNAVVTSQAAVLQKLSDDAAVSKQRESEYIATIASLASQRQTTAQQVAALPDNQIKTDLETKLGGALDAMATLRKLDAVISDYPLLKSSNQALTSQLAEAHKQVDDGAGEIAALKKTNDALQQELNILKPAYIRAYDAAQKKHSLFLKIITFGLVRDRKLILPDPALLPH